MASVPEQTDSVAAEEVHLQTAATDSPPLSRPTDSSVPPTAGPVAPDAVPPKTGQTTDWAALLAYRTPLQEHSLACDGKAAAVLTALGIMFTIVGRYSGVIGESLDVDPILGKILITLTGAFGLLGVVSVVQAFRTIIPRFPPAPQTLAFFGDILRLSRTEYIEQVESMSDEEALRHILTFNHTLSLIVVDKLAHLDRCLRLFEVAAIAWLGSILLLAVRAVAYG